MLIAYIFLEIMGSNPNIVTYSKIFFYDYISYFYFICFFCKGGFFMGNFLNALKQNGNFALTDNGAYSYLSTQSDCLDLFYMVGALRNAKPERIIKIIDRAYAENKDYTLRILFFARDIRGGLGERRIFRIAMQHLASVQPESVIKNLNLFSEYGRWDDLITMYDIPNKELQNNIINIIKLQLNSDLEGMKTNSNISLLAKWLPSINASSSKTIALAKKISKALDMSYRTYRQILSRLRNYIDIIENRLRTKDYSFDYSKQPSKAMFQYRKAFMRHDSGRYLGYLESVRKGQATINTGSLYPYDIVRKVIYSNGVSSLDRKSLDITWNNLPSYSDGKNSIAVIDGSGSMYWTNNPSNIAPYQVAISLGLYFAEHSTGAFANHFITFSTRPKLIQVKGGDIVDKVKYIQSFNECSNTNIQAVFDLILDTAIKNKTPQSELPENIYIISDMEFDSCVYNGNRRCTNFEVAKKKFNNAGYKLPNIIFWNVNSFNQQVPVKAHQSGAVLVSGATPKIFEMVQSDNLNPMQFMLDVINSDRYSNICA